MEDSCLKLNNNAAAARKRDRSDSFFWDGNRARGKAFFTVLFLLAIAVFAMPIDRAFGDSPSIPTVTLPFFEENEGFSLGTIPANYPAEVSPASQVSVFEEAGGNKILKNDGNSVDPHHGHPADESFTPKIKCPCELNNGTGKGKSTIRTTTDDIKDCIRDFAKKFRGGWQYPIGPNCHTFQEDAMDACCLEKP